MEKTTITLTNDQWYNIAVMNLFCDANGNEIPIEIIETKFEGRSYQSEKYSKVFKRLSDGKFFRIYYELAVVNDDIEYSSMWWHAFNSDKTILLSEVFPKNLTITVYE